MKLLNRVSPILGRKTETIDLSFYAPSPWKIVKCLESNLVYLQNPPGVRALRGRSLHGKKHERLKKRKGLKKSP